MYRPWEPIAHSYNPLKAGSIDGTDVIPHDHGIVRAMKAQYKPNSSVIGDPRCTLFVGKLNPETTEEKIEKVFSKYGKIKRLRLVRDIVTGFSKRYAFVEYESKYDALKAERDLHKTVIDGKEVLVDKECERSLPGWIPRRLGGGLSGKKESGQLRFGGKERPFKRPILPNKHEERRTYRDEQRSSIEEHQEKHRYSSSKSKYNNSYSHRTSK